MEINLKKRKYRAAEISTVLLILDCHSQLYQSGRFDIRSWKNINSVLERLIFFFSQKLSPIGCVSSDDKNHVSTCWTRFQHEHRFMNFNCPTREWAKWVSEPVNGALQSEWAEWAVWANERSERPSDPLKTRLSRVETSPLSIVVVCTFVFFRYHLSWCA